jgi:hypothetical protein
VKRLWLTISAACNIVLFAVVIGLVTRWQGETSDPAGPLPVQDSIEHDPAAPIGQPTVGIKGTANRRSTFPGSAGDPGSKLVELVCQLRASGISEEVIAETVWTISMQRWAQREHELQRRVTAGELTAGEKWRLNSSWQNAVEQATKLALGDDAFERWQIDKVLRWSLATAELDMSDGEKRGVYALFKERQNRNLELWAAHDAGEIDAVEYDDQLRAGDEVYEQRLTGILGAHRATKVLRASDPEYAQLHKQLRDTSVTESQLDALYIAARKAAELQRQLQSLERSGAPVERTQWEAISAGKEREFERILGRSAYAEYRRWQDHRYSRMKRYAKAWQLSDHDIDYVYRALQAYQEAGEEMNRRMQDAGGSGEMVDWNEVNEAVLDLGRRKREEIRSYLGDERYSRLQRARIIELPE